MNILLLQLKRIGDLVLTTPAIEALHKEFPDARINIVVTRTSAGLLPAVQYIDQSFVVGRVLDNLRIFRAIWRQEFDYCIDFTRNDRSAFLTFLSRAKKRIGSSRIRARSTFRGRAYTDFVQERGHNLHAADYILSLLEPLGIRNASGALHLEIPAAAREAGDALLQRAGVDKPFIIFHPGAAREERYWGPERWAAIIEHAQTKWQMAAVLTGVTSRSEKAHLSQIKNKVRQPLVDLSGRTDLLTLTALISRAQLIVTLDSATMHLAAATRTPQVALFGPGNPFHWGPRHTPALVLYGESTTPVTEFSPDQPRLPMHLISTQTVINAMDSLLSAPAA